jgi:predicted permease
MLNDLRHATRVLRSSPGFTATAIVTLALGIGLNTAVFGIVNMLLFRPPAAADPAGLVWIDGLSRDGGGPRGNLTYPDVTDLEARRDVFAGVLAYSDIPVSLGTDNRPLRVAGQLVTAGFFDVLRVRLTLGRGFRADENAAGASPVVVIGHRLWQRAFGADPSAVGRSVLVNGHAVTIIGVAPPGFTGPDVFSPAEVWTPIALHAQLVPRWGVNLERTSFWLRVIGRLGPSVPRERAQASVDALEHAIEGAFPESNRHMRLVLSHVVGVGPRERGEVAPVSLLLMGVTLMVLLIACGNVANLLLARGADRRREIGVRLAVGATRTVLVRQLLIESVLLALGGGAAGLMLALWSTDLLVRFADVPLETDVSVDLRVLGFTAAVSLLTAIVSGLTPALRTSRADVAPALRDGDAATSGRGRVSRLQQTLVAAQLAMSLVLLVGAGLFLRGLFSATRVDVGFDVRRGATLGFDVGLQGYSDERALALFQALLDRAAVVPGVQSATLSRVVPLSGRVFGTTLYLAGRPLDQGQSPDVVAINWVWPGFFETMGIPVLKGRSFVPADRRRTPDVAIVSEAFVRRYWPDRDPIGQHVSVDGPSGPFLEVVGVARDVKIDELSEAPRPFVYLPHDGAATEMSLVVRTSVDPVGVLPTLERLVASLDPTLPVVAPLTLEQHLLQRLDRERALTRVLGLAGVLALALAMLGLHGVLAYVVSRRRREIGVRLALGAAPIDIRRLILGQGLRVTAVGIGIGLLPAIALTYAMAGSIVGVRVADPPTLAGVTMIFVFVAIAAAYLPARRATKVDPITALRAE